MDRVGVEVKDELRGRKIQLTLLEALSKLGVIRGIQYTEDMGVMFIISEERGRWRSRILDKNK